MTAQKTTKQIKLRRGNTAEHQNFKGAVGEITVDTDLKTIRVHDGVTLGGFPLMQGDPSSYTIPWARVTNKPQIFSGNYADLTNKPTIPVVPTAVSQLTNDAGYVVNSALSNFVTAQQLSNSTAGVVQLLTNSLAQKANVSQLPVVPTNVSAFNNDANYTTLNYVSAAIGGALDSINLDWANITNKPTIPTDINQLSDASSLLGSGGSPANLGHFKIENNYIGTVDNPNTGSWGGYSMYLDPHGEGNSGISIPNNTATADGIPLYLYNNGDGGIQLQTNRGVLQIGPAGEIGAPTHFHVALQGSNAAVPNTDLFFGDDFNFLRIGAYASGTTIGTNDRNGGNQFNWTFGTDGNLTLPPGGDIRNSNGQSVLGGTSVADRVQVTNAVDFMHGGIPYMGWQLSGSDTLKLRTNIASGDYNNDAIIVDRQSLAVNVVANLTAGTVLTTDITNKVTPAVGGQVTGVRYWDGAGVNLYVWLNAAATPELVTLNSFGDITGWTVSVSDGNSATVTATNPQGFFTISTDQPLTGTGTLTFTSPNYAPETSLPIDINVGTNTWTFGTDGGITFPTLTVNLHNGGNQQGQVLQFSDVSRQAIITGPTPILGQSAQRLIIQGQNGGPGEGGDVYLWAGDSDSNGGDIKIYAGDADAVPGNGGYINIDAGNGYVQGGHLSLSAGNSALYGGNVTISAGYASQGTAGQVQLSTAGGSVNLAPDGNFTISKNVVLSKPVSIVTQSVTGTVYDNQQNPFTFRILKSANPQLSAAFADPNFVLRWTGTDEGSQAAAQQAPSGMNLTSFVSDDGTYWNFNSWFGLNGFNLAGSIFTVEYGMQVNYTTISTTNTNLRLQSGNKHWTFDTLGNLELPDDGKINYSPATPSDWSGTPPTTIQEAIDRLAALVKSLNSGTGA